MPWDTFTLHGSTPTATGDEQRRRKSNQFIEHIDLILRNDDIIPSRYGMTA
jgi:hypothetical protein